MQPIVTLSAVALLCIGLLSPLAADARCTCTCINGVDVAVCDFPGEPRPPCGSPCPPVVAPPPPLIRAQPPPPGATLCFPAQVQNPQTGQYEWKDVCN